jgi:SWIRM-associated domain at the N-terminal
VSVDWVLDGAQYNEWMNEEDYELEENGKLKVNNHTHYQLFIFVPELPGNGLQFVKALRVLKISKKVHFLFSFVVLGFRTVPVPGPIFQLRFFFLLKSYRIVQINRDGTGVQ